MPLPAEAHLNSTGMGPFYDGLMHFLMSPEDIVPVLALALAGWTAGSKLRTTRIVRASRCLAARGLPGSAASASNGNAIVAALWFLLLGGLLAADAKLSSTMTTALAALLGLYHGYFNGTGMGSVLLRRGACSAWSSLYSYSLPSLPRSSFGCALSGPIAVRVAGSWIVASGLLMLGWAVRKG